MAHMEPGEVSFVSDPCVCPRIPRNCKKLRDFVLAASSFVANEAAPKWHGMT